MLLAGNHDLAVTGEVSLDDFSRGAALAARWTRDVLEADALEQLRTLIPAGDDHGVGIFHGSPRDPVWEYVMSPLQAELCFDSTRLPRQPHRALPRRALLHAASQEGVDFEGNYAAEEVEEFTSVMRKLYRVRDTL